MKQAAIDQEFFKVINSVRSDVHHAQLRKQKSRSLPNIHTLSQGSHSSVVSNFFMPAPVHHDHVQDTVEQTMPYAQFMLRSYSVPYQPNHLNATIQGPPEPPLPMENLLFYNLPVLQLNDREISSDDLDYLIQTLGVMADTTSPGSTGDAVGDNSTE